MPRTPDWVWSMHAEIAKYAIPFSFGRPPHPQEDPDIHAATCVAVQMAASQFLITARHVAEPARDAVLARHGIECLAGRVRVDTNLRQHLNLAREPLDLATIGLSAVQLRLLEQDGARIVRPTQWPPSSDLVMGDPILSVGFPGPWRRHVAWNEIEFLSTSKLALIHQLRSEEFVCQLDPAFTDQHSVPPDDLPDTDHLPGMSGGPGFLVRQERLMAPGSRLCGIIRQGLNLGEGNLIITFARLDVIRPDGTLVDRAVNRPGFPGGSIP